MSILRHESQQPNRSDEQIAKIFEPHGSLQQVLSGFKFRNDQQTIAVKIYRALTQGEKLFVEAGTGTGKSLAYLIPALLSGKRVVISTGTRALQDQLLTHDLPVAQRIANNKTTAVILKGRANYVCTTRARTFLAQRVLPHFHSDIPALENWIDTTSSGERSDFSALQEDAPVWRELTATSEQCVGRACADYSRCFVTAARERAQTSDIIIVNHHLYFADLALRQKILDPSLGVLPPHDAVIFDEAHDLDEVAALHFGFQLSERRLNDWLLDLEKACEGKHRFAPFAQAAGEKLRNLIAHTFSVIPIPETRTEFDANQFPHFTELADEVVSGLHDFIQLFASESEPELRALAVRAQDFVAQLNTFISRPGAAKIELDPEYHKIDPQAAIHFLEVQGRDKTLASQPLHTSLLLSKLFQQMPTVFVSATLTVAGDMGPYKKRIGLEGDAVVVGSPFDYQNHALLYLPTDLPLPEEPTFAEAATNRALELIRLSHGGALVLCTSYRMVRQMSEDLRGHLDLPIFVQREAPAGNLLENFRLAKNGVLIATMGFWKGIDVPGSALRLLIIDKLPFAAPNDPLVKGRSDALRRSGEDPFLSLQIPQAVLHLRQGFGRLIRHESDHGVVAIFDRRLTEKRYGKIFLKSLPPCTRTNSLEATRLFIENLGEHHAQHVTIGR